jgi:hypothetical protein
MADRTRPAGWECVLEQRNSQRRQFRQGAAAASLGALLLVVGIVMKSRDGAHSWSALAVAGSELRPPVLVWHSEPHPVMQNDAGDALAGFSTYLAQKHVEEKHAQVDSTQSNAARRLSLVAEQSAPSDQMVAQAEAVLLAKAQAEGFPSVNAFERAKALPLTDAAVIASSALAKNEARLDTHILGAADRAVAYAHAATQPVDADKRLRALQVQAETLAQAIHVSRLQKILEAQDAQRIAAQKPAPPSHAAVPAHTPQAIPTRKQVMAAERRAAAVAPPLTAAFGGLPGANETAREELERELVREAASQPALKRALIAMARVPAPAPAGNAAPLEKASARDGSVTRPEREATSAGAAAGAAAAAAGGSSVRLGAIEGGTPLSAAGGTGATPGSLAWARAEDAAMSRAYRAWQEAREERVGDGALAQQGEKGRWFLAHERAVLRHGAESEDVGRSGAGVDGQSLTARGRKMRHGEALEEVEEASDARRRREARFRAALRDEREEEKYIATREEAARSEAAEEADAAMLAGDTRGARRMGFDGLAGLGHHLRRDWALQMVAGARGEKTSGVWEGPA